MKEWTPYVYKLTNKTTSLMYIGVRYAKKCHPSDLFTTYFSSSKAVHRLIDMFGIDDWIIEILHTYPSDAASAIKKEAEYFDKIRFNSQYLNMCYSSGCIDPLINSKAGRVGGSVVKARKHGIFKYDRLSAEYRQFASNGGSAAQKTLRDLQKSAFYDPALRTKVCSAGGLRGAFTQQKWQREFGKRGGVKNKGSFFYTDGIKRYKYTARQQQVESFADFLNRHPQYHKGIK